MLTPERSRDLLRAYAATRSGAAFRELLLGFTPMVHAVALRVARGRHSLAADVTQTVFTRLAAAPEKVRDPAALASWLHAAAVGAALDALRAETRRHRRERLSWHLTHPSSSSAYPGAGPPDPEDTAHTLSRALDSALASLPPADSRLLLMRFWQHRDWRAIGQSLGLSDDTAQKRATRALARLRRILARRGVTTATASSFGAGPAIPLITAALAAAVPPPASASATASLLQRLLTAIPLPASPAASPTAASSTLSVAAAMTTKKKTALTLAALLIAAAVPTIYLYQQQTITSLQDQLHTLRQAAPAAPSSLTKPTAPRLIAESPSAAAAPAPVVPAPLPSAASPPAPADYPPPVPDGPEDYPSLIRRQTAEKLTALRHRLSLTPEQEALVAAALPLGQAKTKIIDHDLKVIRASAEDKQAMTDLILAALTPAQREEYTAFRSEEQANAAEAAAGRELASLQSLTTLTPEQKDQVFAALSRIASQEYLETLPEPGSPDPAPGRAILDSRWSARQSALSAILTPEQMVIYQQAANPHTPTGG